MFKVIIGCERDEQVDMFECDSITIWNDRKLACFRFEDNGGCIDREYYKFSSYNTATDFIMFKGGSLVSDLY